MRRLLALSLVSVVALGAGVVACSAEVDNAGLNPQPLPPDDKKEDEPVGRGPGASTDSEGDRGSSSSSGGENTSGGTTNPPAPKADAGDGG